MDEATNGFLQLSHDEQWERIHRRVLFEGANEHEHWMHREIERLRKELADALEAGRPWRCSSVPGDVHIIPMFGKSHEESSRCWCGPRVDLVTLNRATHANTVWVHEAQQ